MGERITVEEVRDTAVRNIIRLELGDYRTEGPRGNIVEVETWSAWNNVVNELTKEGYVLVTSSEYAQLHEMSGEDVDRLIRREGRLFALLHFSGPMVHCAVPLEEKEPPEGLGPMLH